MSHADQGGVIVLLDGDCPRCGAPCKWRIDYLHGEHTIPTPICKPQGDVYASTERLGEDYGDADGRISLRA